MAWGALGVDAKSEASDQTVVEHQALSGADMVPGEAPVRDSEWGGGSSATHFYNQEAEGSGGRRVVGYRVESVEDENYPAEDDPG